MHNVSSIYTVDHSTTYAGRLNVAGGMTPISCIYWAATYSCMRGVRRDAKTCKRKVEPCFTRLYTYTSDGKLAYAGNV